jgi:hypothetical protein
VPAHRVILMHFDDIVRAFRGSPTFQRLALAFAVGLIVSCAANAGGVRPADDESSVAARQ